MADDDENEQDENEQDEAEESGDGARNESMTDDAKAEHASDDQSEDSGEDDDPEFGLKDDEPANDVQMKYLEPLAEAQGEEIPEDMSEADAAEKINEMQENASG